MDEKALREKIKRDPNGITAYAYHLGLKDKAVELSREIEKLIPAHPEKPSRRRR
jgi:hypothetical protein